MKTFILILTLVGNQHNVMLAVPFTDKLKCEKAGVTWKVSVEKTFPLSDYSCVEK